MDTLLYRSTNRLSPTVSFREALLTGQPPDYGLYMPTRIPRLAPSLISSFSSLSYAEIAFEVCHSFLRNDISATDLKTYCTQAYNFDLPIEPLSDHLHLLRLDQGPTASFKDFAARLMARIMNHFASQEGKHLTVLVATSGDTGGAIADAFHGLPGISVVILLPEREVSIRQRLQMTTLGKNITTFAVSGKFDDCQAMVKRAFNDPELRKFHLTSANSINIGRLIPQTVYYFYAASRIPDFYAFSVPSGNFGSLMGGVFAREMGLPTHSFIAAVNENNEFPEFLKTGTYHPVSPSRECSSNAMNVGHPSNLARLIDHYGGMLIDERDSNGTIIRYGFLKKSPDMSALRKDFLSFSITDQETNETILRYWKEKKILIEPHGAVAILAAEKASLPGPIICLETAHPAKFPETIRHLLHIDPALPASLSGLEEKKEEYHTISNRYDEFLPLLKNLLQQAE
jgi:threonine synthase